MNHKAGKVPEPTLRASVPILKGEAVYYAFTPHYEGPQVWSPWDTMVTVLDDQGESVWLRACKQTPLIGAVALHHGSGDDVAVEAEYCLHPGYGVRPHFASPRLRTDARQSDVYLLEDPVSERIWVTVTDFDGRKRTIRGAPRFALAYSGSVYGGRVLELRIALCDFVAEQLDETAEVQDLVDVYGALSDGEEMLDEPYEFWDYDGFDDDEEDPYANDFDDI